MMPSRKLFLPGVLAVGVLLLVWTQPVRRDSAPGLDFRARETVVRPAIAVRPATRPGPESPGPAITDGEPFEAFLDWAGRYSQAGPAERAGLEEVGAGLARRRLTALGALIRTNPAAALARELPYEVRRELPPSVAAFIEEQVSRRADFEVMGMVQRAGDAVAGASVVRAIVVPGGRYEVFTHGDGLRLVTRQDLPVGGIAVPAGDAPEPATHELFQPLKWMALRPNPARIFSDAEAADHLRPLASEPVCSVSGAAVGAKGTPAVVEVAGQRVAFDEPAHARAFADATPEREHVHGVAAAGGEGAAPAAGVAFANSATGPRRYLFLRVGFTDGDFTISTNNAVQLLGSISNYFATMSYGKLRVAPLAPDGSAITPVLEMQQPSANYDNAGLSRLLPDAVAAARARGYPVDDYSFHVVFTTGRPAAGYAGVAYVGARGCHLANGYFGEAVTTHELGHNMGLLHAHFHDTGDASVIGDGTTVEYGHPFDQMGGGGFSAAHYAASHKWLLGWITDDNVATAGTGTATHRLYVQDQPVTGRIRGIRVPLNGPDYWVECRSRYGEFDPGRGVMLNWANDDGNEATLLDVRPGEPGEALVIGRTFSDTANQVFITPVGRANTIPPSVDVTVTVGVAPTNRPPVARVRADRLQAHPGQVIEFTADATDPNGDSLAYFWRFADGTSSSDNQRVVSHAFADPGEYAVQCSVSDQRGGVDTDTMLVRVGTAPTFNISGRVLDQQGRPLAGVRINAGARFADTDTDGRYVLSALGAGSYTLSARDPVRDATRFDHPFFTNPITTGPSFNNADFIAGPPPVVAYETLINTNATWRYFDSGADPGPVWREPAFDDRAWPAGPGVLGYGNGGERTVLGYGPDPGNKPVTCYFRKSFVLASPTNHPAYRLHVLRDDGIVVHLNGVEIFRDNMPTGIVTAATRAVESLEGTSLIEAVVPPGALVAGTNVFAVEVHQASPSSSDLTFALAFSGLSPAVATGRRVVYLAEPADRTTLRATSNVVLSAVAQAEGGSTAMVEFFAGANRVGVDDTAPFGVPWTNAPWGVHSLRAVATFSTGLRVTSAPVSLTLTAALPSQVLVPTGAVWRYLAGLTSPPGAWRQPGFSDAAWPAGPAELGFGEGDEATRVTNRFQATTYFRHAFTVADPDGITNLLLRLKRDDGAIVWLNGVELLRDNLTNGPVDFQSLAFGAPDDGQTFGEFTVSPAALVAGTNVLAVEVHQSATNSSDLSFDLGLTALHRTNRARGVWLTSPAGGILPTPPSTLLLTAEAVAGGAAGITRVEFYRGTNRLGQDTTRPWSLVWSNPPAGALPLRAVAWDSGGAGVTSAIVVVTVPPPGVGTSLVSFGADWLYLDTGEDPGPNWIGRTSYDDASWPAGPARLGYGGDGEMTVLNFGDDPDSKHITTWFRRKFNAATTNFAALRLRVTRDDGVVVFLNRVEVFRNNLPTNLVDANTLALGSIGNLDETVPLELTIPNGLREGENQLAVEVHQASPGSSDLGFDLALDGLTAVPATNAVRVMSPVEGEDFTGAVSFTAHVVSPLAVSRVEYVVDGLPLGGSAIPPYAVAWPAPPRAGHAVTARAHLAGGTVMTSAVVRFTTRAPRQELTLIAAGAAWRYLDDGSDPGPSWRDPGFDDSPWGQAAAKLGFGDPDIVSTLRATNAAGQRTITCHFRRTFEIPAGLTVTNLSFRMQRDDGVVIHLNGVEAYRDTNMPAGPITAATLARTSISDTHESAWVAGTLDPAGLRSGANVLAVEVHQASATSSDLGFALELTGAGHRETPPAAPARPRWLLQRGGAGQWGWGFPEFNGYRFVIEASTDLQSWEPQSTNLVSGGVLLHPVDGSAGARRFFRARWLP